jgi:hypothetical protein
VHHVAPLRNSLTVDERRRHPRHKPTSIIYVALGPGNGGILVNLGVGGVSLQAATKLNAETELALNFRLQGAEKTIETVGRVAWLDPSQKGAGISFKDLPANTEQIAAWIASQEHPTWNAQSETRPHPVPTARSEPLRPPIQVSIPAIFPSEKPAGARSGSVPGFLDERPSEFGQRNDFGSPADAAPPPVSVLPALPFRTPPEERFESSTDAPLEFPAKPYGLPLEPPTVSVDLPEVLPRDVLLPDRGFPAHAVVNVTDRLAPEALDSSALVLHRRRRFAIGLAAGMMGILGVIVTVTSIKKPAVADSSGAQTIQPISPPAAALPEKAPQTKQTVQTGRAVRDARSRTGSTGADSDAPVPVMRVAVAPAHQDNGFMESLRVLLGLDVASTIDPTTAALPVWTVQHSGFYYCARSPDFRTLEPGAIMTQGQALQSGYQPKLGDYCK